ncbi:histidine kinase [Opitutus terrae]|uniref:Integral membrane sensor signal transduction histidine kinase n=1 Tax=Opitutus terrae (strain DSM 11246 / JCM 15787 / PB90-1) TaxID=452637 RepID=B1ZR83_OPITP|nr:histidine kinase [Opitutus terrae]ACB74570.1 integral membrane sensor signal transduction histidine kinase [Opitutus terrae PB90-1]
MMLPRCLSLLLAILFVGGVAVAQVAETARLTSAASVLSLSAEQAAKRLPITVTGVVTAAESDWSGQFFVQDETGGVFVENLRRSGPAPGDVVTVSGVSHPGAFAPIISLPEWRKLGTAPLPAAKPVLIENLEAGFEDGLRIEITGLVRTVVVEPARTTLELAVGGFRLQVCAPPLSVGRPDALIAARVRVRGTTATHYNAALRHLTSVAVYVPTWDDLTVLEPEATNPFTTPPVPLKNVAGYRRDSGAAPRMHVRGRVTYQRAGDVIFVQDDSGGLQLQSNQTDVFTLGDEVEAAGFLEYEHHLPLLRDAVLRRGTAATQPVPVRPAPWSELKEGLHHGASITLRGRVLEQTTRPVARTASGFSGLATTWLMQGDELSFTAECETAADTPAPAVIPIGSVVEWDGVCVSTVDTHGRLQSLKLLLPSPTSFRIVAQPSWFTPQRLLIGMVGVSLVLIVAIGWLLTVSRKNAALRDVIRERESAQRELQEAHDTLEQKVAERTAQLHVEMGARKTEEVQFRAVLAERTRLARDLHDTLEQTLTGIALQLDTAAKLFGRDGEQSQHHLQLARNWLHQSQVDLRRSIWDLRSRELEQFDLAKALRQSAEQLVDGTSLTIDFRTTGDRRPLPEVVEENVLRIGQEAFTNIAKHARARRVLATLTFSPSTLRLRIEDDGVGFNVPAAPSAAESHFGLLGMTERAKRLGGHIKVDSAPGQGTSLTLEVPLEPLSERTAAASVETTISSG